MRHLERYLVSRRETCSEKTARKNLQELLLLVKELPGQDRLHGALADYLGQHGHGADARSSGRPGYSDRELSAIVTAARSDVVAIRDRVAAGERPLERFLTDSAGLPEAEREQGARLEVMARTGRVQVDYRRLSAGEYPAVCYATARQLFMVDEDLTPLMIYAAVLSGRNLEKLKELPAEHRLLEGRAVAVTLTKRRRGKANSRTSVHWSVDDDPGRQLRTTGGFYPLLHRMMARSRALSSRHRCGQSGRQRPRGRQKRVDQRAHRPVRHRTGPAATGSASGRPATAWSATTRHSFICGSPRSGQRSKPARPRRSAVTCPPRG
ncbi:hypothetical protein GCM10011579_032610 [Streptomyces albiflavescens]|uniref:Uncharacterized protein n=1 Tax=Streptomyces albiflavescens TaxID=1623582 RepID=A0A917Y1M0_9ACTN|nr:hypothetical protein [Streptomyces albiflavescens]GGN63846.1 hypothetical protein GCM10011579_032610 [Streptomyces albiflavescens]